MTDYAPTNPPAPVNPHLAAAAKHQAKANRYHRWARICAYAGIPLIVLGVLASIFANQHKTPANVKQYLTVAHSALPGRSDSDEIAIGKAICTSYYAGASTLSVLAAIEDKGVSPANAELLIAAATVAYCPSEP